MSYNEINGDLIKLALEGKFDVITHGCNCFCTMGAGIAPQMAKAFGCDKFGMESYKSIEKLGCIDHERIVIGENNNWGLSQAKNSLDEPELVVINSYTQYHYGKNHIDGVSTPVDYEAITLCMRKINHIYKGKHIGLPKIGAGLAGGNWVRIKQIIQSELKDCDVTVVIYNK